MENDVRILIADDHELLRRGIRHLLEACPQYEVCGEATNGREAVAAVADLKPNVVIMDVSMPEMDGLEATRQIVKQNPQTQVLILTMHDTDALVREVLGSGARGYVLKADVAGDLLGALACLAQSKPYFTSRVAEVVLQGYLGHGDTGDSPADTRHGLSPREREVVQLIAEGMTNREIGAWLKISVKTAESHRAHIMRKLDIHSVGELVRYAVRNGIVQS